MCACVCVHVCACVCVCVCVCVFCRVRLRVSLLPHIRDCSAMKSTVVRVSFIHLTLPSSAMVEVWVVEYSKHDDQ